MPKRSSIENNRVSFHAPQGTRVEGKNPAAVALGRLGGLKGGKARANKLSPEQRQAIARRAAAARWGDGE
jgi:hypothetical protein